MGLCSTAGTALDLRWSREDCAGPPLGPGKTFLCTATKSLLHFVWEVVRFFAGSGPCSNNAGSIAVDYFLPT